MTDGNNVFKTLKKPIKKLEEANNLINYSDLEKTGLIKTFEYTFKLAWKTLKDLLEFEGFEVKSPRETIKQAFQTGYIADGAGWLDILDKRNLMTHAYDEETSEEVLELIKDKYFALMEALHVTLNDKIAE